VFSMMRLFPVVLIVFVCSVRLPDALGCLSVGEAVGYAAVAYLVYNLLDDSEVSDECGSELKELSDSDEYWTIYCCTTSSKGWEKITCGNGVKCSCSNVRGNIRSASSSKCLRFLYGNDPDAQAKEHCRRAKQNPNYCNSGGKKKREAESRFFEAESNHTIAKRSDYACASSPAVDARPCYRRLKSWDSRRFAKIRAMQCPCCYVPSVKRSICGYNSCPCTRKSYG